MYEAGPAVGFLGGFDVRSDVRSVSKQAVADNKLFLDLGQILVQPHRAEGESVGFFKYYVFSHRL
jgi:hypothetical protein